MQQALLWLINSPSPSLLKICIDGFADRGEQAAAGFEPANNGFANRLPFSVTPFIKKDYKS